jgi:dihydropteroate synthase
MKISLANRILQPKNFTFVMGIINATPNSFFEKSRISQSLNETIENSLEMIEDGADILDIGGESSKPGSEYICENEEIDRVLPVVEGIRKYNKDVAISVDTRKTNVIKTCVNSGADILNDISALEDGENIAEFVSESKIPVILMHKRGIPFTMQKNTKYADVIKEVSEYLCERADFAFSKGINPEKIIFDLGIGFGKDLSSNLDLIANCNFFKTCWEHHQKEGTPILMALSRKTCIGELTGKPVDQRLSGSLSANIFSVMKGASILRVHDVKETVDAIKVLTALLYRG